MGRDINAVWVRNEWSRFLALMAKQPGKYLIPCYKGIDAYDMPPEFNKLQAQDMGKVGAMQDLVRGVEKLMDAAPVTSKTDLAVQALIEKDQQRELKEKANRRKLTALIAVVVLVCVGSVSFLLADNYYLKPNKTYKAALALLNQGEYSDASKEFESIKEFKDSEKYIEYCAAGTLLVKEKYDDAQNAFQNLGDFANSQEMYLESMYQKAASIRVPIGPQTDDDISNLEKALGLWDELAKANYRDSAERFEQFCEKQYDAAARVFKEGKIRFQPRIFAMLASYGYKDSSEQVLKIEEYAKSIIVGTWQKNNKKFYLRFAPDGNIYMGRTIEELNDNSSYTWKYDDGKFVSIRKEDNKPGLDWYYVSTGAHGACYIDRYIPISASNVSDHYMKID